MRGRVRGSAVLLCGLIMLAGTVVLAVPAAAQTGYDRPGGDYASAPIDNGDPAICAVRCERDRACRSWSFAYPPVTGGPAMCWLKREVPPRVEASCCISGVRGAGVTPPPLDHFEYAIDRTGGDYRSFELRADDKARQCAEACQAETRCRAWTYRRAGYGIAAPRCFLKETIKPPHPRPCCISGVVR